MRNLEYSKLIYFLATFTSEDLKEFRRYLASPIFNRKEEPVQLLDFIVKYCLKSTIKDIDEKKAMKFIWPGQSVPAGRLNKLKNALLDFCLDYMSFRRWNSSPGRKAIDLLRELNRINDHSYFTQYLKKAKEVLENKTERNIRFYELNREMNNQRLIYMLDDPDQVEEDHYRAAERSIEINIITLSLKWAFLSENRSRTRRKETIAPWMQQMIDSLQPEDLEGTLLASMYYYLYQTAKDPTNDAHFSELKTLVIKEAVKLDPTEARDIYTGTLNSFLRRRKITGSGSLEEIFEIYQTMVEVVARGKKWGLNPWHFKNIVYLGSILGEFEWVGNFLEEDLDLLASPETEREVPITYNKGVFEFYRGNFSEAQRCFNQILPLAKAPQYELDSRAYLMMCAFETGDSLGTESQVHAFRMFLSRSKRVPEVQKENYTGFIRLYRNLLATPPKDDVRLNKLRTDIDQLKFNAGKTWLKRKLKAGI